MLLVVWLRAVLLLLEQHLGLRDQVRIHRGSVGLGYLSCALITLRKLHTVGVGYVIGITDVSVL